ncbi:UpxZ family transcription anti-terminator antagonist [Bacteroides sp.]
MLSLQSQIAALCRITHELLNLGFDGTPLYSNHFCELNTEVYRQAEVLFTLRGSDAEEEAQRCYVLLTAYHATIYDHGNKNLKIQSLLDCSRSLLEQLPASLLKCQLLVACYSEVFDDDLAQEAHAIINSWTNRDWTREECEVSDYLDSLEANPWSSWEIVE